MITKIFFTEIDISSCYQIIRQNQPKQSLQLIAYLEVGNIWPDIQVCTEFTLTQLLYALSEPI